MLYLIDAAVILNDELFFFDEAKKYATTYRVTLEFRDFRSKSLIDNAVNNGILRVMDPADETLEGVEKLCSAIGTKLSETDVSLVALAVELREKKEEFTVITDDYSIQNVLLKLQIPFQSVIRGEIKKFRTFR